MFGKLKLLALTVALAASSFGASSAQAAGWIIGLVDGKSIVTIDPATRKVASKVDVKGAGPLLGIDVRPADGVLYGVAGDGAIVTIDDGKATVDGSHKYKDGDANARKTPKIVAGAYTNSWKGAKATTLYNIDAATGALVTQAPPNDGVLNTVGSLGMTVSGPSRSTLSRPAKTRTTAGSSPAARSIRSISRPARRPWSARSRAWAATSATSPGSTSPYWPKLLGPRGLSPRAGAAFRPARRDVASADEERPCRYPSRSTTAWCTSRTGSARTRSTAMCSAPSSFGARRGGPIGSAPRSSICMDRAFIRPRWRGFRSSRATATFASNGTGRLPTPSPTLSVAGSRSTPGRSSASAPRAPAPASISATPTARCWNSFPIIATTETAPDDRPPSHVPPDDTVAPRSDDGARRRAGMDGAARDLCDGKGRGRGMSPRDIPPQDIPPQDILVPISVGELMDKITILEIKSERLKNPSQLENVTHELTALRAVRLGDVDRVMLDKLSAELKRVNAKLWDVEDAIRECEARSDFGPSFIELARVVYRLNDERSGLKKAINLASGSRLIEEKSYSFYHSKDGDHP